jgi:predicted NBD/HSP70 family sugar kinase
LRRDKNIQIGIGAAGIINETSVVFSPNIPYLKNFDFKKLWPGQNLRVDNDARCFARAEVSLSANKKFKNVLALTIGTGVGRALAKNGEVAKIKRFEYPEKWEKEYQKIRDEKDTNLLSEFLSEKLAPLIKLFNPNAVIIGGGVSKRRNFFKKIETSLKKSGVPAKILKSRLGKNAVALGAILQYK